MKNIIKFCYKNKKKIGFGIFEENQRIVEIDNAFHQKRVNTRKLLPQQIRLLPPISPTKIICVGLNYSEHISELKMKRPNEPLIFIKPPSSIIGPYESIEIPKSSKQVDYEGELAIIIKKYCKNVSIALAKNYILGYTCLNDITARDIQKKEVQWTRAKSYDTFCPIGPWITAGIDANNLSLQVFVNNKIKQNSNTTNFIFGINEIVSFISKIMTLSPGDIISTGTPPGVGQLKQGDTVEVKIEKIGSLINFVK